MSATAVLVVPCHNEERRLQPALFLEFLAEEPSFALLFVDDGSRDNTRGVVEEMIGQNPDRVAIHVLEKNQGKGEAVRQGMQEALDRFPEARYVGFWDADLATPLWEAPRFSQTMDERPEFDFVIGSRIRHLGAHIERSNLRHMAGRVFATCAALAVDLRVYDSQCGAKMFRSEVVMPLFDAPFQGRWTFDLELLARQKFRRHRGDHILEIPLKQWIDTAGSQVKPTDAFGAFWELLKIYVLYSRRSPIE